MQDYALFKLMQRHKRLVSAIAEPTSLYYQQLEKFGAGAYEELRLVHEAITRELQYRGNSKVCDMLKAWEEESSFSHYYEIFEKVFRDQDLTFIPTVWIMEI